MTEDRRRTQFSPPPADDASDMLPNCVIAEVDLPGGRGGMTIGLYALELTPMFSHKCSLLILPLVNVLPTVMDNLDSMCHSTTRPALRNLQSQPSLKSCIYQAVLIVILPSCDPTLPLLAGESRAGCPMPSSAFFTDSAAVSCKAAAQTTAYSLHMLAGIYSWADDTECTATQENNFP